MIDVTVTEREFTEEVRRWCEARVRMFRAESADAVDARALGRVCVKPNCRLYHGAIPWSDDVDHPAAWDWHSFHREVDLMIGIKVQLAKEETYLPFLVMELKCGEVLNTDELDKKSAVYGALREIYPWVHCVFLHRDNRLRGMRETHVLRNARQFNTHLLVWDETTQRILGRLIDHQLDYLLSYWKF